MQTWHSQRPGQGQLTRVDGKKHAHCSCGGWHLLDNSMNSTGQGPQAAILVLFLVVFLMVPMLYYMRETAKAQRQQRQQ